MESMAIPEVHALEALLNQMEDRNRIFNSILDKQISSIDLLLDNLRRQNHRTQQPYSVSLLPSGTTISFNFSPAEVRREMKPDSTGIVEDPMSPLGSESRLVDLRDQISTTTEFVIGKEKALGLIVENANISKDPKKAIGSEPTSKVTSSAKEELSDLNWTATELLGGAEQVSDLSTDFHGMSSQIDLDSAALFGADSLGIDEATKKPFDDKADASMVLGDQPVAMSVRPHNTKISELQWHKNQIRDIRDPSAAARMSPTASSKRKTTWPTFVKDRGRLRTKWLRHDWDCDEARRRKTKTAVRRGGDGGLQRRGGGSEEAWSRRVALQWIYGTPKSTTRRKKKVAVCWDGHVDSAAFVAAMLQQVLKDGHGDRRLKNEETTKIKSALRASIGDTTCYWAMPYSGLWVFDYLGSFK